MKSRPPAEEESASISTGGWTAPFGPRFLCVLGALGLLGLFVGNASTSLWDQDEAAYAGFARQMLATGDWVVPDFLWSEPHRKPPLLFWAIAASFRLLGESEFALRLPTVLATILTIVAVGWLGRPLFGAPAALIAAVALGTGLFVPNLGKVAVTDALLLLFQTVAVLALHHAIATPTWRLRWTLLFWTAIALGLLVKGPPILVLTGGLAVFLLVFHPGRWKLVRLHPLVFLPLAAAPLAYWGWLAWQRTDGVLVRWMLDWYVLRRASNPVFGQTGPPGYFLLSFIVLFFPWFMFLPSAAARLRQRWREPGERFVIGWLLFGWIFYEVMASKLPTYALGAYPALALLVGREVVALANAEVWSLRRIRWSANVMAFVSVALALALVGAGAYLLGATAGVGAAVAGSCLIGLAWRGRIALRAGDTLQAARVLAVGSLAFIVATWLLVIPHVDPLRAMGPKLAAAMEGGEPPTVVYPCNGRLPSVPFYVGRTHPRQLDASPRQFEQVLADSSTPYLHVLDERCWERLQHVYPKESRIVPVSGWNMDKVRPTTWWLVYTPVGSRWRDASAAPQR